MANPGRKPRLLIVVNDAAFFLSHRLPLALGAREAGFDAHVATPRDAASARIEAEGLPFHAIPLSRGGTSVAAEVGAIRALVSLYRELRPDVVHHVTAKPILYGGIAARIARVPAVVHAVSGLGYVFISDAPKARAIRLGVQATYGVVTSHPNCAVIFQNEDDRRTFGRAIRTDDVVMTRGSGVDLGRFASAPLPPPGGGASLVVMPSRMLWDKGVREFVDAARASRDLGARFALVGGVDPANPAAVPRDQIDAWVREGVIDWWGPRDDMPEVLRQASIVCLPSYREGMPKALIEAVAVGRPIVTTDVPGCRDVLAEPGEPYGCLVPAKDGVALAAALRALLVDRPRLERMADAARRAAPAFAVERVVAETIAVYRRLLRRVS